jgi:hypothetical protein
MQLRRRMLCGTPFSLTFNLVVGVQAMMKAILQIVAFSFTARQTFSSARRRSLFHWRRTLTLAIAFCFVMPGMAQATIVWSACQTITAVSDEPALAVGPSILLALSPGISGCSPQGVTGAINFTAAQGGIASADLSALLATSLTAFSLGKRVMVAYDNSTTITYDPTIISPWGDTTVCGAVAIDLN